MFRFARELMMGAVCTALLWTALPLSSQTPPAATPTAGLMGTVKGSDGKPLEGVGVSARHGTLTTTVWTNLSGEYSFPPLPEGKYTIWAQAVGFEYTRFEQTLAAGKKVQQNFTLPPYKDAWRQMSDVEWIASFPEDTAQDKKLKRVLVNTCFTCHNAGYALEKRFSREDWELVFDHMSAMIGDQDPPHGRDCCFEAKGVTDERVGGGKFDTPMFDKKGRPMGAQERVLAFYRKDLIDLLVRVRGPESYPLKVRAIPRPTGESANIVVTEYDVPEGGTINRLDPKSGEMTQFSLTRDGKTTRNDEPEYYLNEYRNGTMWHRGISDEGGQHDLIVGNDKYVYLTPTGVGLDPKGNVIYGARHDAVKFDVKEERFTVYPLPEGSPGMGRGKDVDSKGNFWGPVWEGVYKLDAQTLKWTFFPHVTKMGREYGLTIDGDDNVWTAQIALDKLAYVDGKTGKVGEVSIPPVDDEEMTDEDRNLSRGSNFVQALYQKGPRRLHGDRNPGGRYVWVGLFYAGRLGKIDGREKKFVADYKFPEPWYRYGYPYDAFVDKNGMVYVNFANADVIAKFNPKTEQFTYYPIPTRAHNARHIGLDNKPAVPEVWIPESNGGKVARIQFRGTPAR